MLWELFKGLQIEKVFFLLNRGFCGFFCGFCSPCMVYSVYMANVEHGTGVNSLNEFNKWAEYRIKVEEKEDFRGKF